MSTDKKKISFLYVIIFVLLFFPMGVMAQTHDYSLQAYDWDVTANDWEGAGTEDEILDGGYLQPGQTFKVDVYYVPGDTKVTGMQVGISYDPSVITPVYDSGEVYVENDMSTTYQGGIWPAAGTSATNKKKTNWNMTFNDDTDVSMIKGFEFRFFTKF